MLSPSPTPRPGGVSLAFKSLMDMLMTQQQKQNQQTRIKAATMATTATKKIEHAFMMSKDYICQTIGRNDTRGIYFGDDPLDFSGPALMLQLSIISLITRAIYVFLKPFGQPLIVSQILGGVILGPSVLGHNSAFLGKLFPPKSRIVLDTLSVFGLMLFIFVLGVKMDLALAMTSDKKPLAIGVLGFVIPYGLSSLVAFLLNHFLALDHDVSTILSFVIELQSMSAFPVIASFLADLEILNSEIGRLASSSSIVSDVIQWSLLLVRFAARIAKGKSFLSSVGSFLSVALFILSLLYGIRPAALCAIRNTQEGKPVKEVYIFLLFVALLGSGFIGEVIGLSATIASFILGVVIPDGPPLGAALTERLDALVSVLLMPLFFALCGLQMNVFAIQDLKNVGVIQLVVFVAFIGKIIGTIAPPLFYRMPFRDALSLALIMNSKGIVELALLNHKMNGSGMNQECFAIMIISVLVITAVLSPLVKALYNPSRRYLAYKRRTIRHHRRNEELRMLACVYCAENVRAIMDLLDASNPTEESPINLIVLHLVKLIGRSSSLLVPHHRRENPSSNPTQSERIFNAFSKLEHHNHGLVTVQCFKGMSPYATMHDDVCSIALEKRTSLIIIPFKRDMAGPSQVHRQLNRKVFGKAPCSVGVLVDHGRQKSRDFRLLTSGPSMYCVAVLFFGGADDREALAYGMRMWENPIVMLTLIRFCCSSSGDSKGASDRSRLLDGEILAEFRLNTLRKEERVSYVEEPLTNVLNLISFIRSLKNSSYDLIMVGRRHAESRVMNELVRRTNNGTGVLGAVGEILASLEVKAAASVLVVQQQTRVWGLHDPEESLHLRGVDTSSSSLSGDPSIIICK